MTTLYRTLFNTWIKYFALTLLSCCLLFIMIDSSIHFFSTIHIAHYLYLLLNYQEVLLGFSFLFASTKSILDIKEIQLPLILQLSHIKLRSIIIPILHSGTLILIIFTMINEAVFTKAYNYKHNVMKNPRLTIEQFHLSNNQELVCIKKGSTLSQGYLLVNDNEIWHIKSFSLQGHTSHLHQVSKLTNNESDGFTLSSFAEEIELVDIKLLKVISSSDRNHLNSLSLITLMKTLKNPLIILTRLVSFIFPLLISLVFILYLLFKKSEYSRNITYLFSLGYFIILTFLFKITCIL